MFSLKNLFSTERKKYFKKEIIRIVPFLAIAGIILIPDSGSTSVVLFAIGIVCISIAVAHIARKLLFPGLDLQLIIDRTDESPVASAMVVLGIIYLVTSVLSSIVALLR